MVTNQPRMPHTIQGLETALTESSASDPGHLYEHRHFPWPNYAIYKDMLRYFPEPS